MNNGQREVIHTHHKEESQAPIQNDNDDRYVCVLIHSMMPRILVAH